MQYTSSGRISTEKTSQALTYCSQLSRPTLPSIKRTSQILSYRRQLSDLQLKLSLFLQQPHHHSSSSSLASSVYHSETSLDSLVETRRFGHHHHITITQNDITPLLHAANNDIILSWDVDFEVLYAFAESIGYKFTDAIGPCSDAALPLSSEHGQGQGQGPQFLISSPGVRNVEETQEGQGQGGGQGQGAGGGYIYWLSGGKSMSPYRFTVLELEGDLHHLRHI